MTACTCTYLQHATDPWFLIRRSLNSPVTYWSPEQTAYDEYDMSIEHYIKVKSRSFFPDNFTFKQAYRPERYYECSIACPTLNAQSGRDIVNWVTRFSAVVPEHDNCFIYTRLRIQSTNALRKLELWIIYYSISNVTSSAYVQLLDYYPCVTSLWHPTAS
jgi:hypothetical protein